MQRIRLPYYVNPGEEEQHTPPDVTIHIKQVYHENAGQNGAYMPDGVNPEAAYRRYELDALFGKLGWQKVSDDGQEVIYEGPLNPMPQQ